MYRGPGTTGYYGSRAPDRPAIWIVDPGAAGYGGSWPVKRPATLNGGPRSGQLCWPDEPKRYKAKKVTSSNVDACRYVSLHCLTFRNFTDLSQFS